MTRVFAASTTRAPKPRVPEATRRRIATKVNTAMVAGLCSTQYVEQLAASEGVNPATVYRWAEKYRRELTVVRDVRTRRGALIDDAILTVLFANRGNVARTWRELVADGVVEYSEATLRRALRVEVDALVRTAAGADDDRWELLGGVLRHEVPARNLEWQMDSVVLPLEVENDAGVRDHPTVTIVLDAHSRYVLGYAYSCGAANSQSAVLALTNAMRRRTVTVSLPDGTTEQVLVGGVPARVLHDNATEFLSHHVTVAAADWGVPLIAVAPHTPHLKGKIERLNRTVNDWARTFGPATDGPQARDGSLRFGHSGEVLTSKEFELLLAEFFDEYNHHRTHRALGRQTPMAAWLEARTVETAPDDPDEGLVFVADDELDRHVYQPVGTRKVSGRSVQYHQRSYLSEELAAYTGTNVELRVDPADDTFVECWIGDTYLARAVRTDLADHAAIQRQLNDRVATRAAVREHIADGRAHRSERQRRLVDEARARAGQLDASERPEAGPIADAPDVQSDASVGSIAERLNQAYREPRDVHTARDDREAR